MGNVVDFSGVLFQYFVLRFDFGSVVWKAAVSVRFRCSPLSVSGLAYNEWLLMFQRTSTMTKCLCHSTYAHSLIKLYFYQGHSSLARQWNKFQLCLTVLHKHLLPVKPTIKTNFFLRKSYSNAMILIQEFERSRVLNFQMMHVIIE